MAGRRSPMVRAADVIAWLATTAAGLDVGTEAIQRLRATEGVMTWGDILDESGSRLRERLTKGATRTRARSGKTSTRSKRRPGRPPRGN